MRPIKILTSSSFGLALLDVDVFAFQLFAFQDLKSDSDFFLEEIGFPVKKKGLELVVEVLGILKI